MKNVPGRAEARQEGPLRNEQILVLVPTEDPSWREAGQNPSPVEGRETGAELRLPGGCLQRAVKPVC